MAGEGGSRTHLSTCMDNPVLKTGRATGPYPPPFIANGYIPVSVRFVRCNVAICMMFTVFNPVITFLALLTIF